MSTVFLTGGTGLLGIHLVHELIARGDQVIAIHRPTSDVKRLAATGARLVVCGLDDVDALARAMPEGVDAVYHVAGDLSWWRRNAERQYKTNVEGTRNVVEAALRQKAKRFVHTSSFVTFGLHPTPVREDTPSNAEKSPFGYVRTKWQGERAVAAAVPRGLSAVIMNPGNILGPFDTTGWARLILMADRGRLPAVPPGKGSFCHAVEVARAHIAAASRGRIGEHYLLGGADATFVELGAAIAKQLGRRAPRAIPAFAARWYGAVNDLFSAFTGKEADSTRENADFCSRTMLCDSSKAIAELGYVARSLDDMVAETVAWLRAEGKLRH